MPTHQVTNQVRGPEGDLVACPALAEALARNGAGAAAGQLRDLGALAASAQLQRAARIANTRPPVLHTHDRYGNRIDEVEYPAEYHTLMAAAVGNGLHAAPWAQHDSGRHVIRAAKMLVWAQTDCGHLCPVSMTYAAVPALRSNPELAARYEPLLASRRYDPVLRVAADKPGLIAGMSMTEKQGGSDVRANTTTATPDGTGGYRLCGHKWFTSAPMSDLFLTLAQAPGGLSCFLVPRVLPDGVRNPFALQRLKDKLGNRSNASAEVEYDGTLGWLIGEEGQGVSTIVEMVNLTRLDCALLATAGMRLGVAQAVHHATYRRAFGVTLRDAPAMRNVLADLAVESEAATLTVLRLARAIEQAETGDALALGLRRIAIAISKYWPTKRWPGHTAEALECLGGNGYIEDFPLARLYREAPLTSIWEGSGNVAALDALRAIARQPATLAGYFAELEPALGIDARFDDAVASLRKQLADTDQPEFRARRLVQELALVLQGALLLRDGNPAVADLFLASRLAGDWGGVYGTLPTSGAIAEVLDRASVTAG